MTLVSFAFVLFIAATAFAYFLVPIRFRWVVLLISSYLFFWFNSRWLVLVLFITTLVTFGIGQWIQHVNCVSASFLESSGAVISKEEKKEYKAKTKQTTKRILLLGIVLDLGTLLVLKYGNFFLGMTDSLLIRLRGEALPRLHLLLPLGISFYTMQAMAYMIDVYRGKIEADRNPLQFMLFMSYFPQIVQGPIPRYGYLAHQLYQGHDFDYTRLCHGIQLMLWGWIKKMIIADRIAIPADYIFDHYTQYTGLMAFLGAAMYGLQVYADFSGGMDIARGVSQMLGIELELNFRQPYFSTSIEDFWRRWHITLGGWMRDYIFYPLSLSKAFGNLGKWARKHFGVTFGKKVPAFLSMFIVYFLVGFWHGPSWKYIAYGIWNGIFIMTGILFAEGYQKALAFVKMPIESDGWKIFQMVRTFLLVSFGRFFSRADRLKTACSMFISCFKNTRDLSFIVDGSLLKLGLNNANWILLVIAIMILFFVDLTHERNISIRDVIDRQHIIFRWLIYIVAVLSILIFGIYGPEYNAASFVYEQF